MKTKKDVQKAAIRSAAVVVSFVLVSYTVSAQEFWKKVLTNSSLNEIAVAMVESSAKENVPAHSTVVDFEKAFDPALELEEWMTSENYFFPDVTASINEPGVNIGNLQVAVEEPLKIENWMTSTHFWNF